MLFFIFLDVLLSGFLCFVLLNDTARRITLKIHPQISPATIPHTAIIALVSLPDPVNKYIRYTNNTLDNCSIICAHAGTDAFCMP